MSGTAHHRAFVVATGWTLGLLLLGSVVHATNSSLACPDWPTCFGTMMPEMTGGVFWEHLHRIVAGVLIVIWVGATYLAFRGDTRRWVRGAALWGIALLLVQSVLGGITVLLELPDAVSSSHLAAAFLFLALATVLTVATSPRWFGSAALEPLSRAARPIARRWGIAIAALVFGQSVLGAVVRHTDAGMACAREVLTCRGGIVPPSLELPTLLHFGHRLVGLALVAAVVIGMARLLRAGAGRPVRRLALLAVVLVVVQAGLGFYSVATTLNATPVSLHTLFAALLLAVAVGIATWSWARDPEGDPDRAAAAAAMARGTAA